jgi:serine/threonine-protein kinase
VRETEAAQRKPARWPWILLGSAAGAAVVLTIVLLIPDVIGRKRDGVSTPAAGPTSTTMPAAPPAEPVLDGVYRVDINRANQTYNHTPDPQPPNVSTWWAFHSSCTSTGCVATGTMLDDGSHHMAATTDGSQAIVLHYRNGHWQSESATVRFPCLSPDGTQSTQTTTQVLSLQPPAHGALRGVMIVAVQSD